MLHTRYPMRWCRALFLLGLVFLPHLSVSASSAEASVELHARCLDARCRFSDGRLYVELEIRNTGSEPVVLPLEYYQRRGPTITFVDNHSGKRIRNRMGPPNSRLLDHLQVIEPAQSRRLRWILMQHDIGQQPGQPADVTVEFGYSLQPWRGAEAQMIRTTLRVGADPRAD
ncbi:hypothetical protein [Stenotrophomonas rhizophila]|uniref:hypothetical protein n=1 Tax=Stenotrophomonas rhizophila TaxID=216778 RepID=UPI0028D47E16|nr:hypothetical protein [Stenotrophomonas rhizophila]